MRLPYFVYASKLYWKLSPIFQRIAFQFHKTKNANKVSYKDRVDKIRIFLSFLLTFGISIPLCILAVVAIEYAEHGIVKEYFAGYDSLHSYLKKYILLEPSGDLYKDFAAIIATLAGIYFATVTIVTSTSYSQLSIQTRNLVLNEKLNNFYFNFLVSQISLLLVISAINIYGYKTGTLLFCSSLVLVLVAILGFIVVNLRLSDFFDPTVVLRRQVLPNTSKVISNATVTGYQWYVPAVQQHYQRLAESLLEVLGNVVDSAFKVENDNIARGKDQLKGVLGETLSLLRFYGLHKASIPPESLWFKRMAKQPNWFTSDSTITDLGMYAGGSLQPELVPDNAWFERELITIIVRILQIGLLSKDNLLIAGLYINIQRYIEAITEEQSSDIAQLLLDYIRSPSRGLLTTVPIPEFTEEDVSGRLGLALAVTDCYCMSPLSVIIGFRKAVEALEMSKLEAIVKNTKWFANGGIYRVRLPKEILDQFRYIQKGLQFEVEVESCRISPTWYLLQLGGIGVLRFINSITESVIRSIQKEFVEFSSALIKLKRYPIALQVIERGLEACSKFEAHLRYYEQVYTELENTQKIPDIPRPRIIWDGVSKALETCREKLIENFAKISPTTVQLPQDQNLPDYFGKAYWVISQECFRCIIENKQSMFKLLFPLYFIHAFAVYERFVVKYQETKVDFWAIQNVDILCDLLSLSGYALTYRELGNKEIWEVVKAVWDSQIKALKAEEGKAEKWLITIIQIATSRNSYFGISKRGIVQTSWMQRASADFRQRGLITEREGFFGESQKPNEFNGSKILEYIGRSSFLGVWSEKAHNIFIASYLLDMLPPDLKKTVNREILRLAEKLKVPD